MLDISIVITGLPEIQQSLGLSNTALSWVQNAYTLSFGGLLLLGARAGDLIGRKKVFLAGLALFGLSSLVIGLATGPTMLLAARVVQGMGAAVLAPTTLALLSSHFAEGAERTKALSYYAATAGVGSSLGLVLGGVFAGLLSWRIGFLMNVPVAIALYVFASKVLTESDKHDGKFDIPGTITSVIGMTALVYGLFQSTKLGVMHPLTLTLFAVAAVSLSWFVRIEKRSAHPLLPLSLFSSRERVGAYLGRMLFLGAMVSFFFFTTQFLQKVLGFSPVEAGLAFLPVTIPTFIGSTLVPRLSGKCGSNWLMMAAFLLLIIGMFGMALLDEHSAFWPDAIIPMLLLGLGNGMVIAPLTVAGVSGVAKDNAGAASGAVNAAHQLGGTIGLSLMVMLFAAADNGAASPEMVLSHKLSVGFEGCVILLVLGMTITAMLNFFPSLAVNDYSVAKREA